MNPNWTDRFDAGFFKTLGFFGAEFVIIVTLLLLARKLAFSSFTRWARKTDTKADDIVLDAVRHPSVFWAVAIALYFTIATSELPARYVEYGLKALYVIIILSVTLASANIFSKLAQGAIEKSAVSVPVTGLSMAVVKAVIFAMGFLIVLGSLGISITPILTALGVGGLAVALALQDTLSNLFAGVHILVERSVKVGDYVKVSSGEEGFVSDIGWRTTRIRQLGDNIIIIPNNKLSQSVITNFSMPGERMALPIKVGVSYSSDIDRVERVLLEEAQKAVGEVKGLLPEPLPAVRLVPGFTESSIELTLVVQVDGYAAQFDVQHELRKRIFKRFKSEGIEFPFPSRTVYLKQ